VSPRLRVLLACALLAPAARPCSAADALLERVERALASMRGDTRQARVDLAPLLESLERRDRAQQAEFDAVASRPLPPKARQRLEETRQAWASGQGRLLESLRALRAPASPSGPAVRRGVPAAPEEVDEALALLRQLRAASRTEPLSAGELKNRVPDLRPPALALGPATQVVAGDEPPIGSIAPEVREKAASFSGPIETYEWVRNAIRPELYHGVMKGPAQTLLESSGNDADTAGLLIALLRARGIPARYVSGTVDLPAALAVAITGTASPERALRALKRAGVPAEPAGAGGLAAIRVARVWAEAYLPYANYRGALLDGFEKAWVPLDPGLKRLDAPGGYDVRSAGFEPVKAFDDYLVAAPALTPREFFRQRAEAALAQRQPAVSYEEALARRDVVAQSLGILPASLPYAVVARAEVGYAPPEALVHTARFVVEAGGTTLLDAPFAMPALLGRRLTLSYVPFEPDDEEIVRQYGGLSQTPPYLVEVKPVLKLAGLVLASGTAGAGLGVKLDFRIELGTPGGSDTVENRVIAGNLTAIGFAAGQVTADESRQDEAARILARLAFHYLDRWNRSDEELAALLRVVAIRPSVSTCLVQSAVEVEYAGGDPLYPVRYDWKGLAIDADRRPSAPVGIERDEAERDFLLASGLEGSVLEHRLFEDDLGIASVSTAKALQLAAQQEIEVLDLGPESAESALPGLPLDDGVKDEIRKAAASGYRVRVPAAPLTLQAWTGTGYLVLDPATGESAWQLQGGHSGGVTAPAVVNLPKELVDAIRRESETPSPWPGGVAFLQKFDTTDYQTGTVDTLLPKPFKVLVTDEEGFPVPEAAVTFSVIGGAGVLVDPATGRASAEEITVLSCAGGEEKGPCASLKPGEAVASLRLGQRTGEIPRYTCEAPFTCTCPVGEEDCSADAAGVGYTTQVGLNLVTASSGAVVLAEPFTAIGFPERVPVEGTPGAIRVFMGLAVPPQYNPVNLTVPDRLALSVADRHGNPISNVAVDVAFEGPPELGPPPAGGSLFREATETPGHVLRLSDYERCVETNPSVIWGECPGEDLGVRTRSSSLGAFVYPVVGDSPWSYYKFNWGTDLEPTFSWIKYHTNGLFCPSPYPSTCTAWDAPQTLVWQGTRATQSNLLGNMIEAYPPGGTAEVGLWADVVYEEATVKKTVDGEGHEHFKALGTNVWKRERLLDSEFALSPISPGTAVDPAARPVGEGRYTASMTMSGVPWLNSVGIEGTHYAPVVKYLEETGGDVDPATVDTVNLTLTRVKDPDRPTRISDSFALWGVSAKIEKVVPSPIYLGSGGVVLRSSSVSHEVKPDEYRALLTPRDLRFEVRAKADNRVVLSANGEAAKPFEIPAGLSLASGQYYGQLSVRGVSAEGADLASDPFNVSICSQLELVTKFVKIHLTRDPLNGQLCGTGDLLRFRLCRDSLVTLTVGGREFTASVDGSAPRPLTGLDLPAGEHAVLVPVGLPELEADEQVPFSIEARDVEDPTQATLDSGIIASSVVNRSVLPVGHTFVKGVDLLDGHVVQQSTDLKVPGRHLGLELTRTYSSAGSNDEGPLGGGWSLNYAGRLFEDGRCGLVSVVTPDGGSQVFHSSDGLTTFTPQKGYHTRLEREGRVYRFVDKAGNVHHFESQDPDGRPRLDYIEEPHGDRLVFTYDGASLLTKVAEVQAEAGEVRALTFAYRPVNGFDRIVRAEMAGLGLAVDYDYDTRGNLVKATRDGRNLEGGGPAAEPRVEKYGYLRPATSPGGAVAPDPTREHQLVEVTDPNGHRREFLYYGDDDSLPGESDGRIPGGGLSFTEKWELAKQVVEHPEPGLSIRTEFSYDAQEVVSRSQWKTTVRDGRGRDTLYVLNGNGSPLRIEEPLGKTTTMAWADDDIFKTREQDANGRVTEFGYDPRGNLTLERIQTSDLGPVVTEYRYDTRFNKLTWKKDAEGRETNYAIHSTTGDLLETLDPVGNRTRYGYDEHGRLQEVTDPRGYVTKHRAWDSFGNAGEVEDPLGNVTTRTFDLRGRLGRQADTMGRETSQTWDGLDRLVRSVRTAGGDSDDEVTETGYHAGGEVRSVRNANGAETTYTIDGLSRVVGTRTRFDQADLTTATTYDANGNKETETDRRGVTKRFVYDDLNRLAAVSILSGLLGEGPTGTIAEYGYDLVGNKTSETNLAGLTTGFELDGLYRARAKILPETNPATRQPYREESVYDRVGNVTRFTDANGKATETQYDGLNRATRQTRDVGGLKLVTTTAYDDPEATRSHVNKSEEHDLAKGLRTAFVYDALNRETTRSVRLEGEDGDPTTGTVTYTTTTAYEDDAHTQRITGPRGVVSVRKLDGLDHVVEETVDVDGLSGAAPLNLSTTMAYDGLGGRKRVTDPENRTTRSEYDGLGRLVKVTDAVQQVTRIAYDGEGLKTSETDRREIKRTFAYDNIGRPRREAFAAAPLTGVAWSRETRYQDKERQRIEIDARGKKTTFDLDGLDRVVKETDALGNFRTFAWDGVNKIEETDRRPAHNKTRFEYDGINRLKKVTDPAPFESQTVVTTYEDAQNRVTEKNRRDFLKRTQLDPLGRVMSVTRAVGTPDEATLERNTYDPAGNKETQTDAEGRVTRFAYDAANRLASRTDGFGTDDAAKITYAYDKAGNQTEERDARAAALGAPWSVKKTYDDLNRLETEVDGEGDVTHYGYDPEGNRTEVKTPKGPATTTTYDELGKPLEVTQPPPKPGEPSPVTHFRYDENRNLVRMEDADGRVTKLDYDELNRLFRTTRDPGGLDLITTTTEFDEDGHPKRTEEANGEVTRQTWDELGRLSTRSHEPPASWTVPWAYTTEERYHYDPNSNLERVEETDVRKDGTTPPIRVTTRGYDKLDRQTSETVTLQNETTSSVTTEYWRDGRVKSVTDPRGATSYTYDGQGREETVTTSGGVTRKTYYPDGLVKDITFPNLTKRAHDYDKADRVRSIVTTAGDAAVASTAYTYDPNGNRLTEVQTNGGAEEATGYTYDDLDRLATVTYAPDAGHPNGRKVTYGHDGAGNRKTEVVTDPQTEAVLESKTGHFDNANRLFELTDNLDPAQTTTLGWDKNGNLLSETKTGVTTNYRYDLRDTLAEVERGGQSLARFLGDFDERRVLKIGDPTRPGGSGVQEYVYNGSRLVLDVENGQPTARYEWTNQELVSLLQSGGQRRYFALDGLETVLALTDEAGQATDRLNFDAWGVPKEGTDFGTSGNRFAFTSHRFDTELDLYYAGGRMYSPTIGRFIGQDTLSLDPNNPDTWNLFSYVRGNPTRYVDPTGHAPEEGQQTPSWVHLAIGAIEGMNEFQKRLDKLPEQAAQQTVNLLTPGHSENKGVVAQKQRELLAVARDAKKPVVARVEAAGEALKMQPAVIVEETVVRPAMEAPGHAKAAGQHLAQAEAVTSPLEKAVHVLEATKETAQAFTGLATPAALVSGGGRTPAVSTSEAEAVPRAVRVGEAATDDFASQATGAARQTMATGKEWYDYLAGRYGSSNVEWVSGSGRTIQWPSQLPAPPASEMLRVRPPTRSGSFVPGLASAAGPRPAGAVAHHVKPLFMGGSDSGTTNAAWTAEAAHQAGHATLNREVVPLPYGTWIVVKP
jgi:RHS repeat-associated protein